MTTPQSISRQSLVDGYGTVPLDEAIDAAGEVREPYRRLLAKLDEIGEHGIDARRVELEKYRAHEGIVFTAHIDGEYAEQVFPLDPVPRLIDASSWAHLQAGAAQRARALNAFLADIYGGEAQAAIIADGIIPNRIVRSVPGYRPAAAGLAPGGHPRATVHGLDLLTDQDGRWVVLEDNLQVPSEYGS